MNIESKIKLNNGVEIPMLGLGTYLSDPGKETYDAVRYALEVGYRHIDTAAMYGNEVDVGSAVRKSGVPRENVFITTKVWNSEQGYQKTLQAFDLSLKNLNMDYVDLYLIHWPLPESRAETWKALEKLYKDGLVRSIGVSNYTIKHITELLSQCEVAPVVNQVEFSPFLYQKDLQDFCMGKRIYIEAYSPLTRGKKFTNPRLLRLSNRYKRTPAQIMIRWALQVNTIVIPKSVMRHRIVENANVFDFEISSEDMTKLCSYKENYRVAWNPTDIP